MFIFSHSLRIEKLQDFWRKVFFFLQIIAKLLKQSAHRNQLNPAQPRKNEVQFIVNMMA